MGLERQKIINKDTSDFPIQFFKIINKIRGRYKILERVKEGRGEGGEYAVRDAVRRFATATAAAPIMTLPQEVLSGGKGGLRRARPRGRRNLPRRRHSR